MNPGQSVSSSLSGSPPSTRRTKGRKQRGALSSGQHAGAHCDGSGGWASATAARVGEDQSEAVRKDSDLGNPKGGERSKRLRCKNASQQGQDCPLLSSFFNMPLCYKCDVNGGETVDITQVTGAFFFLVHLLAHWAYI